MGIVCTRGRENFLKYIISCISNSVQVVKFWIVVTYIISFFGLPTSNICSYMLDVNFAIICVEWREDILEVIKFLSNNISYDHQKFYSSTFVYHFIQKPATDRHVLIVNILVLKVVEK